MERREAIKYLSLSIGSMIALPSWANSWKGEDIKRFSHILSPASQVVLEEIVDTIIPTTDTPGAKAIGVAGFVEKMIKDCYDKKASETFVSGINNTDLIAKKLFNKNFSDCSKEQRIDVLKNMASSENKENIHFYNLVKNLTIQGYLNSEYVMTNLLKYEMVPSRFHGCVPVTKK